MEELQATQEEIARKERDYVARIRELESRPDDNTREELLHFREEVKRKENHYKQLIAELEQKLEEKPLRENDWELAREVEKTLKINLEALRLAQLEQERRTGKS